MKKLLSGFATSVQNCWDMLNQAEIGIEISVGWMGTAGLDNIRLWCGKPPNFAPEFERKLAEQSELLVEVFGNCGQIAVGYLNGMRLAGRQCVDSALLFN